MRNEANVIPISVTFTDMHIEPACNYPILHCGVPQGKKTRTHQILEVEGKNIETYLGHLIT